MQKTFDAYDKAAIKNAAKAVVNYCQKKEKAQEKLAAAQKEIDEYEAIIVRYENSVKELTGGYSPLELCEKVSRGSQNDWVFKYPNTIVPAVEQNEHLYEEEVTLKDPEYAAAVVQEEQKEEEKKEEVTEQTEQEEKKVEELPDMPEQYPEDDPFGNMSPQDNDDFFNDNDFRV